MARCVGWTYHRNNQSSTTVSSDETSLPAYLENEEEFAKYPSYLRFYYTRMAIRREKKKGRYFFEPRSHETSQEIEEDSSTNESNNSNDSTSTNDYEHCDEEEDETYLEGYDSDGIDESFRELKNASKTADNSPKHSTPQPSPNTSYEESPVYPSQTKRQKLNVVGTSKRKLLDDSPSSSETQQPAGCQCNEICCSCYSHIF